VAKSRSKNDKNSKLIGVDIHPETRKAVWGVFFFAIGLVFMLAFFNLAGPAGQALFTTFSFLMGWGYFLLPAAFLVMGIIAITAPPEDLAALVLGIGLLFVSFLGISHIANPMRAGFLGMAFGSVQSVFGFWASLVILGAVGIAGILVAFHSRIRNMRERKEEKKQEAPVFLPSAPEPPAALPEPKSKKPEKVRDHARPEKAESLEFAGKKFVSSWDLPPIDLLDSDEARPSAGDVRANSNIIKRTLENFSIPVEMGEIHVGPTVTQYTLKPAQGVKLAKIVALQNDLALALAAHPIRIEAPIPGKSLVGIEVPNKAVSIVRLRNLFVDGKFLEERDPLVFMLGRNVEGVPVSADLSRMPHILVAGATGSGKSIFIHTMLISFLFKNPPQLLRLILIDPKRVELSQYQGIPHLLTPVITEGKRAIQALRWAIQEMDRRYALLLGAKARDIMSYNASRNLAAGDTILPFVVIIIDELADLMAAYGREIEGAIVRLAQMARATGIHLVVSTQRPSVEVITGLIKANITSRVAFQVASQVDSRTILDAAGAEKLLGAGDMLFLAQDTSKPRRIQAPYVSEIEVKRVVEFLSKQGEGLEMQYQSAIPEASENGDIFEDSLANAAAEDDPLFEEALKVVIEAKKASASLLQRRLKVGYARAARLLDIMEARGIIGPGEGAKPREVYGVRPDDNDEDYE